MINLKVFFKNHFDTKEISDDNMKKFTEDHIQRLAANNPGGAYAALINATTTAYNNYFGVMSDEDLAYANQQAKTIAMKNVFEEFKNLIRQKEGLIRANWNKETPEYQNFFPFGLAEYSKATLANVLTLMARFETLTAENASVLGQPLADLFADVKARFINARDAQLLKKGEVSGHKEATSNTRDELEIQLMKNLLTISLDNIGKIEGGMVYYDQSFIRRSSSSGKPEPEPAE